MRPERLGAGFISTDLDGYGRLVKPHQIAHLSRAVLVLEIDRGRGERSVAKETLNHLKVQSSPIKPYSERVA